MEIYEYFHQILMQLIKVFKNLKKKNVTDQCSNAQMRIQSNRERFLKLKFNYIN